MRIASVPTGRSTTDTQTVRHHLAELLKSPQFQAAPRLSRFLSFIVESALEGRSAELKESLIAVEVYGRPADYNPQVDSTVRVEAWRLRAKLREYYETAGAKALVMIDLPKGRYIPEFRERHPEAQDRRRLPALLPVRAVAAVVFVVAAATLAHWNSGRAETPDPDTLKLYSRAWELLRHYETRDGRIVAAEESVRRSIPLFEKVVQASPRFARGWASLAEANEFAYELDRGRAVELLKAARHAARRAVQLDSRLPEAQTVLCSILFFRDWDLGGAERACRRAVELNPKDVVAQRRRADLLRVQGRWADAATELDRAISLAPGDPGLRLRKARLFYDARQYQRAAEETRASLAMNVTRQLPSWTLALWLQGLCQERMGRTAEAEASYRTALAYDGDDMWNESALAHLFAKAGRRAEAEALLTQSEHRAARGEDQHFAAALVQLGLGDRERALASLERGFARREDAMLFLGLEQRFDTLRSEPRFQALLRRLRSGASSERMSAPDSGLTALRSTLTIPLAL